MTPLSHEAAQAIAMSGFSRLAADDDLLMRFCNLTGLLANEMREAAQQPGFLVGVLDFYLSHEPTLLEWVEAEHINPEHVMVARVTLAPEDMSGF